MKQFPLFLIFLGTFFTVGCTSPTEFPLSETHVIQGFGYSIDYPAGWLATTEDTVTFITQKEEDFNKRYFENFVPVGIFIGFDHRDLAFLTELGLPVYDPTLNDLFQLNIDKLTGMTNPKIEKTTLFGVNALQSEYYENDRWEISYAGYIQNEAFYLAVSAPSKEILDDFRPTWEIMLSSIRPVDE